MGDAGKKAAADDGERSLIGAPPADGGVSISVSGTDATTDLLDRLQGQDAGGPPTPWFVFVLTFFSALGGFIFGYDTGVVSGAMLLLKREMGSMDALWQELVVSSTVGAAAVSALLGGALNGALGRRVCILLASGVFAVGGVVLSIAPDKVTLLLGRVIVGLGIGVASMTVPVYIAEVSPPHLRGQLVTLNNLFITGGQLIASLVDGAFSYMHRDGWRYMLGLSVVPAVLQFTGFLFLPESPRWLLQKGRCQESRAVLQRIRGVPGIEEEFDSIRLSVEEEKKEAGGGHAPTRRALIVGCGMQMFQQLCGINTVMYYSATILQMAGVRNDQQAIWLASATAATNFLFTLVGVWLVERVGRRRLSLGSMLGTSLSLCVLANYTTSTTVYNSTCLPTDPASSEHAAWGSCSSQAAGGDGSFWAYNYCPTPYSWVVLLGLLLYLASFAPGMGPMPWTVNSEIYPLWARSTGNACSAGVNWTFNVLVSLTFLHVAQEITYYGVFFLYAAMSLLGVFFILGCLPETRGLQLEEIEGLFAGRLCSCGSPTATDAVHYIRVTSGDDPQNLSDTEHSGREDLTSRRTTSQEPFEEPSSKSFNVA
ncbi:hypothetical protein CRUP_008634 [Coryphaenoides rupestris]|nr:hypothetical protein CRUP_008634 [Coryphaenoides rupestris]